MNKLVWRLSKLPTVDEITLLLDKKLITQNEAKAILFKVESEEDRDTESFKSEIKFLRELIDKLSTQPKIVETIKYIEKPYYNWPWYRPYGVYCQNDNITLAYGNIVGGDASAYATLNDGQAITGSTGTVATFNSFKDINTF